MARKPLPILATAGCFVLLLVAGLPAQVTPAGTLSISDEVTAAGTSVMTTVSLTCNDSLYAASFGVLHAAPLTIATSGVVAGTAVDGISLGSVDPTFLQVDQLATGTGGLTGYTYALIIDFSLAVTLPATTPDTFHEIARVTYDVPAGAAVGSYPLTLTDQLSPQGSPTVDLVLSFTTNPEVIPTTEAGSITVPRPYIRGDVNGSGHLSLVDIVLVARYVVGLESPTCLQAYDVDGSLDTGGSSVTLTDAMYLAQFLFMPNTLPPPAPYPVCGLGSAGSATALGCNASSFCAP